ncbi:hypothetical protein [Aliarcobacter cryaerophilus]|uniref:hypothetical protein n=1 Tax=Aliarcobacter cryaerophilus TaxID=28198 RepID=UPI003DA55FBF
MYFVNSKMLIISNNIQINHTDPEYLKIKNSISVLNFAYLEKASIQLKHSLANPNFTPPISKHKALFSIYNKLIKEHQIMFLLFNIFENSLRSKAAISITEHFSSNNSDDWWKDISMLDKNLLAPVQSAITQLHKNGISIPTIDTFDIFDTFTFGQLEHIYNNYWSILKNIFNSTTFNGNTFPNLTQIQFKDKISKIRNARNDISHHKPINYTGNTTRRSLIRDVELLMNYMKFNLKDALNNIDNQQDIIPHLLY